MRVAGGARGGEMGSGGGRVGVGAEVFGGIGNVLELRRGWPSKGMWMDWLCR